MKSMNEGVEHEKRSKRVPSQKRYFSYDIDSRFYGSSFIIGPKLSSLISNLSFQPIMRGRIYSREMGKSKVVLVIYPFLGGILTLLFGYSIAIFGVYKHFIVKNYSSAMPLIFLVMFLYLLLIRAFNRGAKQYLAFINDVIQNDNFVYLAKEI